MGHRKTWVTYDGDEARRFYESLLANADERNRRILGTMQMLVGTAIARKLSASLDHHWLAVVTKQLANSADPLRDVAKLMRRLRIS